MLFFFSDVPVDFFCTASDAFGIVPDGFFESVAFEADGLLLLDLGEAGAGFCSTDSVFGFEVDLLDRLVTLGFVRFFRLDVGCCDLLGVGRAAVRGADLAASVGTDCNFFAASLGADRRFLEAVDCLLPLDRVVPEFLLVLDPDR